VSLVHNTLELQYITLKDAGVYYCYGEGDTDQFVASSTLLVGGKVTSTKIQLLRSD